jgi:hypothetical protein
VPALRNAIVIFAETGVVDERARAFTTKTNVCAAASGLAWTTPANDDGRHDDDHDE